MKYPTRGDSGPTGPHEGIITCSLVSAVICWPLPPGPKTKKSNNQKKLHKGENKTLKTHLEIAITPAFPEAVTLVNFGGSEKGAKIGKHFRGD
jgi:hypothetical protein